MKTEFLQPIAAQLWNWVRDTYTFAPADRPNWERYETFFFQWSVGMRDNEDRAGCFDHAVSVYGNYCDFLRPRELERRIKERTTRDLSAWDRSMFLFYPLSFDEDSMLTGECANPFSFIEPTIERNRFQSFWEYICPRLSVREKESLFQAILRHYKGSVTQLLRPEMLNRRVR